MDKLLKIGDITIKVIRIFKEIIPKPKPKPDDESKKLPYIKNDNLNPFIPNYTDIYDKKILSLIKTKGIIGIQDEKNNNHERVSTALLQAKHKVDIIIYYGDKLLLAIKDQLEKLINNEENEVVIRILIAKKCSKLLREVSKLEKVPFRANKIKEAIDHIKEIKSKINFNKTGKKGSIGFRQFGTEIRYALILIDNEWAWWTPYHTGIPTERITSFELVKAGKESFINLCIEHFDKLWEKYE